MEKPCKGLLDMLHNHEQKSKAENLKVFEGKERL
jgi:hypothetical protein